MWTLDQAAVFRFRILNVKHLYHQTGNGIYSLLNIFIFFFLPGFVWLHPEGNSTEWKRKENSKCGA